MSLVKAFSKMLDSIPHDQMFTQMVLSQIVTYYDKCCGWYKGTLYLSFLQSTIVLTRLSDDFAVIFSSKWRHAIENACIICRCG